MLTQSMIFITNIGDKYVLAVFSLIILLIFFAKKEFLKAKIFAGTMALAVVISQTLKYTIKRARPLEMLIEKDGYSFPSGHATLSMAFFGMMIYLFKDKIKNKTARCIFVTLNIVLILLIAISRLYLNVHWPTDVIAGFALGLGCIYASIFICKKIPFLAKNKVF